MEINSYKEEANWRSCRTDRQEEGGCFGGLASGILKEMFQCTDATKKQAKRT